MNLNDYTLEVSEATFESEVVMRSHEVPIVVDFWAEWCGPCRDLGPLLERLAIEAGGAFILAKVNVDENPNLAIRFGVQGIPAVKAFKLGSVEAEFVGAQPEPVVRRFISQLAPSKAELAVQEAQSLLATRHWAEGEMAFREVYEADKDNAAAALGLVKSLLMQGKGIEAEAIIGFFPAGTEWAEAEKLRPLAKLLSEVEEGDPLQDEDELSAELHQSARLIIHGNIPAAMDGFLEILRVDKTYKDGLPKQVLLALFALLGDEDPLTRQYRDELASILY